MIMNPLHARWQRKRHKTKCLSGKIPGLPTTRFRAVSQAPAGNTPSLGCAVAALAIQLPWRKPPAMRLLWDFDAAAWGQRASRVMSAGCEWRLREENG